MNKEKLLVKILIEENSAEDFKTFYYFNNIKVNELNNKDFDLLIYSIEHNANQEII